MGLRGLGPAPQNSQTLAWDALTAAQAAGVDFTQYDNDNNLQLDGFFVVPIGVQAVAPGDEVSFLPCIRGWR